MSQNSVLDSFPFNTIVTINQSNFQRCNRQNVLCCCKFYFQLLIFIQLQTSCWSLSTASVTLSSPGCWYFCCMVACRFCFSSSSSWETEKALQRRWEEETCQSPPVNKGSSCSNICFLPSNIPLCPGSAIQKKKNTKHMHPKFFANIL